MGDRRMSFFEQYLTLWVAICMGVGLIAPAEADQYIAGAIILAAWPCTATVFAWSCLSDADPG